MPNITGEGYGTFEVPADERLVLAIEQDGNVDIMRQILCDHVAPIPAAIGKS